MVLLVILLLQAALVIVPSITVASAAGNVTINDFTCNITKGTAPLEARLTGNVTGEVSKWQWDFYNPRSKLWSYSTGNITTSHTFGRRLSLGVYGVFNVTLVVSGPGGNATLKKVDYVVANKNTTGLPNSSFSASTISGNAPLNVTFTDDSTNTTSRLWYFGLKDTSTEKNPTYTFTSPGTYRVVLEVSNSRGWDATSQEIIVQGNQQGKILPEADFDVDTSNGLNVQFTDLSQNANSSNWNFGDGTNSTEYSPMHIYSKAGNYSVHLTVSNDNGTSLATKNISVEENSSNTENDNGGDSSGSDNGGSSDGGGDSIGTATVVDSSSNDVISSGSSSSDGNGGGGAGASPESQSNVEAKELSQTFIGNGNSVNFNFPQNATPVINISFDSKKTVGMTTTIVEMLINQSTLVSEPPSDEVYKYLNIWVGNNGFAAPDNIENAIVYFKVEKSWIQDKNIDKSFITLNRFNDTKWDALPTSLTGEDDKYLYFAAKTPGFSSFAITGKITENNVNATPSENQTGPSIGSLENNERNATNVEQTPEQTQSPSTSDNGSKKSPGFGIIYCIIGLFAVFLYKRK
jgi:PGF-pre-PGF domain-containing protein